MKKYIFTIIIVLAIALSILVVLTDRRGSADFEKQIDIFTENVNVWSDTSEYFCFTIADLNQDGKLELITSTIQGSSSFSYNDYYIIQENNFKLEKIQEISERTSLSALAHDFLVGKQVGNRSYHDVTDGIVYVPMYYNEEGNDYYYIFHDYSGHTPYEAYDCIVSLSIKDNQIEEKILACKITKRENAENTEGALSYTDGNQMEISKEQYEKVVKDTYDDCKEMQMCWQWKRVDNSEQVQNMMKSELKNVLLQMYENFEIIETDK